MTILYEVDLFPNKMLNTVVAITAGRFVCLWGDTSSPQT